MVAESDLVQESSRKANFHVHVDTPLVFLGFGVPGNPHDDGHVRVSFLETIQDAEQGLVEWNDGHLIEGDFAQGRSIFI